MRKQELEALLTHRLHLESPRFKLRKVGGMFCGHVISDTFKGKNDYKRQQMIRAAFEAEFGRDALPEVMRGVGMILTYTNDEWGVELPAKAG